MAHSPTTAALSPSEVRRNYWAFLFEGGFFVFGIGFVNAQTLLPALILEEGGPSWVAAFMPGIMIIGLFGVPMLLSGWIDTFTRLRPYALLTGFFQRFVYLPVGLLLLFGSLSPTMIVVLLAITPLLSGILGGLGFSAWQRLYMNSVPASRRASNLAYRLLFGGITGIVAGVLIERILTEYPGARGYGWLHLAAALCLFLSWAMLWVAKEPPMAAVREAAPADKGVRAVLRRYYRPGPMRRSRLCFAGALFCMHAFMLITPFYAITLLTRFELPKSFLGILAMWQMGGQAVGNLLAAGVGDRWGGRATFGFGLLAVCLTVGVAPFLDSLMAAQVAYAAFGMSTMLLIVGKDTLLMELSPDEGQSSYLAAMALLTMIALLCFAGVAQGLWTLAGGFPALVVAAVIVSVLGFVLLSYVDDPRGKRINPLRAVRRGFLRAFR
ncbi:MAG: MFS transporter [Opitutales bacterium]